MLHSTLQRVAGTMDLSQLRIGYVPYNERFDQIGDWGRFYHYAKKRNLTFEIAKPTETYDVVIVTQGGDISVWANYHKGHAKVVYDIVDAYLTIPRSDVKGVLRGLAKFVAGQSRRLRLDHWKAIQDMCRRSDAVVCNTGDLRRMVLEFCRNVHMILDVDVGMTRSVKDDYGAGDVFNFVWQGLPQNVRFFHEIQDVLRSIQAKRRIALHIVAPLEFRQYMNKYHLQRTYDIARRIFNGAYVYDWNKGLLSRIITACDMALIPIPLDDAFASGKSANKLLIFWRMGMPTIVSSTPAYSEAMDHVGLPMACRTPQEWNETLDQYMSDEDARRDAGQRGRAFAEEHYGEEKILGQWDDVFASVISGEFHECRETESVR